MNTRNLKALGLALAAVLAIGATAAAGAGAEGPAVLESEAKNVTIDGTQPEEQVQVFTREGKQLFCESAAFHAEAEDQDEAITLNPAYEGCTLLGIGPATVKANGCSYVFNLTDNGASFTALTDLACPEGKAVEVLVYVSEAKHSSETTVCEYTLGSQEGLNTIELTNKGSSEATPKDWVLGDLKLAKISSKSLKNFLICGEESDSSGTLEGELQLKGTGGGEEAAGIAVSEPPVLPGPAQLTLESGTGTIDATQIGGVLSRAGKSTQCEEGNFVAHVEDGDTSITTTEPEFSECTGPLGLPAEVNMGGCDFHFDLTIDEADTFTALSTLGCTTEEPHEEHITVITVTNVEETATLCEYQFSQQENLTAIDLANEEAGEGTPEDWVKADVSIAGIASTRTVGGNLICGAESDENAILEATWELKGTDGEGSPTGLTVSTDE